MEKRQPVGLTEAELCPTALLGDQEAAYLRDVARLQHRQSEFQKVPCPACSGEHGDCAFIKHGFSYTRCADCGTIYMNPRPSAELMADYYAHSENYVYWASHIFPASEKARMDKLHKPRLESLLALCDTLHARKGHLLEIGPGFGTFAALVAESKQFEQVTVVEPTPDLAQACRKRGLHVLEQRIEDLPVQSASADVIVAFEVIEHLFYPKTVIESIWNQLAPHGIVLLTCPNGMGFDIATLGAVSLAVDAEHVNLFNPDSLRLLLTQCGFTVLEITTPGRLDAEFVHDALDSGLVSLANQPFLQRVLVDEWDRLGQPFQHFLAANGLSSHMWLVAQKL